MVKHNQESAWSFSGVEAYRIKNDSVSAVKIKENDKYFRPSVMKS